MSRPTSPEPPAVRAEFVDEAGRLLMEEVELGRRRWVRRPDGNGGYVDNAEGVRRVLWKLPELSRHLAAGRHAGPVYLTEGTSDARALVEHLEREGLPGCVTTNPFGALSWREDYTVTLTGTAELVAIVDNDQPGQKRAALLERELGPVVEELRIVRTPLEEKGADLRDHLAAGMSLDELVPVALEDEQGAEEPPADGAVRIVSLEDFANTPEEGAEAVLGDVDNAVIPEAGDVMVYGDGGAGKTTLVVDLACHLAAGDDWLGIRIPRPLRVLIIENEGPRARFRRKLKRKHDGWTGSPLEDRVSVLEEPWARFTFANQRWRELLAEHVRENEVDVVICGPVTCAGMNAAGTLQEVRDFLALVADVRRRSGRDLVVILVHHENKGGRVSGAWEGAGDTLLHVSAQGHGRLRLHVQKARWASDYHATTLQLVWADGDTFELEEKSELDEETLAEQIAAFIGEHPGTGWTKVEDATRGVNKQRRRDVRDGLLAAGRIVNIARDAGGVDVALDHVPEKRAARLYLADDPTIAHLRPDPGADGAQTAPAWGGKPTEASAPVRPAPERGAPGAQAQSVPPADPDADEWADRIRELGLDEDAGEAGREERDADDSN